MKFKIQKLPSKITKNRVFSDFALKKSAFKRNGGTFLKSFSQTFFSARRFHVERKKLKTFFQKTQNCFARGNVKTVLKKKCFELFERKIQTSFLKNWFVTFLQNMKTIFSKKYFCIFRAQVKTIFFSKKFEIYIFKNALIWLETHFFSPCFGRKSDLREKILTFSGILKNEKIIFDPAKFSHK